MKTWFVCNLNCNPSSFEVSCLFISKLRIVQVLSQAVPVESSKGIGEPPHVRKNLQFFTHPCGVQGSGKFSHTSLCMQNTELKPLSTKNLNTVSHLKGCNLPIKTRAEHLINPMTLQNVRQEGVLGAGEDLGVKCWLSWFMSQRQNSGTIFWREEVFAIQLSHCQLFLETQQPDEAGKEYPPVLGAKHVFLLENYRLYNSLWYSKSPSLCITCS